MSNRSGGDLYRPSTPSSPISSLGQQSIQRAQRVCALCGLPVPKNSAARDSHLPRNWEWEWGHGDWVGNAADWVLGDAEKGVGRRCGAQWERGGARAGPGAGLRGRVSRSAPLLRAPRGAPRPPRARAPQPLCVTLTAWSSAARAQQRLPGVPLPRPRPRRAFLLLHRSSRLQLPAGAAAFGPQAARVLRCALTSTARGAHHPSRLVPLISPCHPRPPRWKK